MKAFLHKCGPSTDSVSNSWELIRNAMSKIPSGIYWIRVYILTRTLKVQIYIYIEVGAKKYMVLFQRWLKISTESWKPLVQCTQPVAIAFLIFCEYWGSRWVNLSDLTFTDGNQSTNGMYILPNSSFLPEMEDGFLVLSDNLVTFCSSLR